jgi:Trypsin-like peptidase domain
LSLQSQMDAVVSSVPRNADVGNATIRIVRALILALGTLVAADRGVAVEIGDSRKTVIEEKGDPLGEIVRANIDLLRYGDVTIKLRDGRVFAMDKARAPSQAVQRPSVSKPAVVTKPQRANPDPAEPQFPKRFVGCPEFRTTAGTQAAGTAFLARRAGDEKVYMLTVQHLLGPDGGFRVLVPHEQVPSFVLGIQLDELFGQPTPYEVKGCFVPSDGNMDDPRYELAVFKTSGVPTDAAPVLADVLPAEGDPVWIIARVRGGVPEGELVHRAHTVKPIDRWFWCEFDNPNIITNGASGAPVLNSEGQVVGIYRGHQDNAGHKFAMIIPSTLILETLPTL